ncbi:MAG: HD domain-containing protein [Bacteroidales bacterium]|nr:HD domain-containing protein [Bacteroidales bacterium]
MTELDHKDLIYKVNTLMKENQELQRELTKLKKNKEVLSSNIEKLENTIAQIPPDQLPSDISISIGEKSLRFNMVTILFIDIHGFKKISEGKNVQDVIDELDQILFNINKIAKKYKLQIIKTIGDTYMVAGGVPVKNSTNPIDVVMAGVEIASYVKILHDEYEARGQEFWEMRIGINTGAVKASAYGKKKISYDLKGETVNIATRMASSSEIGKINISANTYVLVNEYFICEHHGQLPVKYEGLLDMYFVDSLKPEYSSDPHETGLLPNHTFQVKYALRQFADLQEIILDKLEKELPDYLYYHNYKHTIDVVNQAELIGYGEKVTDEEILLLKTAALFHDAGHTISYQNHEYYGCQIAKEILPKYNYTEEQIEHINELIMATELPPKPKTTLERIMCDSDLDYLGRIDFIPVSNTLYDELKAQNKMGALNDWNKIQVKFLTSHQYFTNTANNLREVNKEKQIDRIKSTIEWKNDEEKQAFEVEVSKIAEASEQRKKEILDNAEE